MNSSAQIDLDKISDCIETMSFLENAVNYNDLYSNFEEMDIYFRKLNFEHANCLYYKDSLDEIYENIEYVKRKINELADYLRTSKKNYTEINEKTKDDLLYLNKQLGADLKNSLDGNITTIPKAKEQPKENPPINTVPIGLAIGATGIAGSIGAVIINEKYGNDDELEEYEEVTEEVEVKPEKEDGRASVQAIEKIEPYKAIRRDREVDQFYGNQFEDIILQDDEDNNENQFADDFYE